MVTKLNKSTEATGAKAHRVTLCWANRDEEILSWSFEKFTTFECLVHGKLDEPSSTLKPCKNTEEELSGFAVSV